MSELIQRAIGMLDEKAKSSNLTKTVRFDLKNEGSLLIGKNGAVQADGEADVTLTMSAKTFEGLMNRTVNPKVAMMMGKIRLKGDLEAAKQLSAILS